MASYKVPQDVEADDKLIGFLSMRQFIYVIIAVLLGFIAFQLARLINPLLIIPFVPFMFVFLVLGLYQRKDQNVETYLLAMLTFYFKPHTRKWDQDGILENVKITAPKKLEHQYSDNLSKDEVRSNLSRLSQLMDTRGWVAKNAEFQTNIVLPVEQAGVQNSDRLITPNSYVQTQPEDIRPSDDVLDELNNPTAQNFDAMVRKVSEDVHNEAISHMNQKIEGGVHYNPAPTGMHQKVISPAGRNQEPHPQEPDKPHTPDAILDLVNRKDDNLSVETIAKEAQRLQSLDNNDTVELH